MMDAPHTPAGDDPAHAPTLPTERVYLEHYGLTEAPFSITPDPEFLYASGGHRQVLEKIHYAIGSRMGFILLTGEVGTGKTTVCRTLLDHLTDNAVTAYVINPSVSGRELLAGIMEDTGLRPPPDASRKTLLDALHRRLLAADGSRPFVVIIDDAQTMSPETLEGLRLLSNLETDKHKLVQVILSGQPELLTMLDDDRLRQLKQRIAVHCHLAPLSVPETTAYIDRRLFVAGNKGQIRFSPSAVRLVHKTSTGIPRLINKVCDCAMTAGYVEDAATIDSIHVRWALAELDGLHAAARTKRAGNVRPGLSMVMMLVAGLLATVFFTLQSDALPPATSKRNVPGSNAPIAVPSQVPPPGTGTAAADGTASTVQTERLPASRAESTAQAATPVSTAPETAIQKPDTGVPKPPPAPYAIQLGSFSTAENARRGTDQFRRQGIPANWQVVENGRWFRVFTGKFVGAAEAARYKADHGLESAMVIRAPPTLQVLSGGTDITVDEVRRRLVRIGYDSVVQSGSGGSAEIFAGLFPTRADAEIAAGRILEAERLLARVVRR